MKKLALILLMTVFAVAAFGQKKKDKIREAKIEFIKKKLSLTTDEEKKFIPLYNSFLDESKALREKSKSNVNLEDVDLTFMSDEECEKLINEISAHKQKEVDLIKKYTTEFKKILPVKKVAMIFKAEHEFRRYLVKQLRNDAKKMREEARKIRKEHMKMRDEQRKRMDESKKMLKKNLEVHREEMKKHRENMKRLREQFKEKSKELKKELKEDQKKLKKELKESE